MSYTPGLWLEPQLATDEQNRWIDRNAGRDGQSICRSLNNSCAQKSLAYPISPIAPPRSINAMAATRGPPGDRSPHRRACRRTRRAGVAAGSIARADLPFRPHGGDRRPPPGRRRPTAKPSTPTLPRSTCVRCARCRRRFSCRHKLASAASSSEPPTSVGLACRPVGAWRRQLVKLVKFYEGPPGTAHFDRRWTRGRQGERGGVRRQQITDFRTHLVRSASAEFNRAHDGGVCGSHKVEEGSGDESEGGRLPGGQGHDYRTA